MTKQSFLITVYGIDIAVSYQARSFSEHSHFEFTHPTERQRPIPISRTGYRSHFVHESAVTDAGGPEAFARAFCLAVLSGGDADSDDEPQEQATGVQGSLFD